ncbi:unnamed protein product [Caenorhabditis auriculariae]|uniref:Sidoreflexin n=1 Tax=Caenorhabditis auriculariae TaxID=2777116 RepID=A0A8S1H934_9PELO|nr:unnamed protein product [Caenorhabditis auriculariae]
MSNSYDCCNYAAFFSIQRYVGSLIKLRRTAKPFEAALGSASVRRAYHFFATTNPMNLFASNAQLDHARQIITQYKLGKFDPNMTVDELWRAKNLYDSAYHPDTGEKMFILGRMSAQVPCNMLITGGMLTFYQRFHHVLFFHWLNQSFNAIVNYTNRSGTHKQDDATLLKSYCAATTGAVTCALGANHLISKIKNAPPMLARLVPFAAIAIANAINIPMMRNKEFTSGIPVEDAAGRTIGFSTAAPYYAIPEVVISRVGMAVPNMVLGPLLFTRFARANWYRSWMAAPLQTIICGFMLAFSTPLCCALFPQKSSLPVELLEKPLKEQILKLPDAPTTVYFNKGL